MDQKTEKSVIITQEQIEKIKNLIGEKDEINLHWLETVTQLPASLISRIVIQNLGMVVLEGRIYSRKKAEIKLRKMQEKAQADIDRESFKKSEVDIDMMKLREKLWTVYFDKRLFGQQRHQYCPIWQFLEEDSKSKIILRYDWIDRLNSVIERGEINEIEKIEPKAILNELGADFRGKAVAIFAKSYPQDTQFGKNKAIWIMFLVTKIEGGVQLVGLNMINVLTLSSKFKSRERAYNAFNEYLEYINYIVNDPSLFEKVILVE